MIKRNINKPDIINISYYSRYISYLEALLHVCLVLHPPHGAVLALPLHLTSDRVMRNGKNIQQSVDRRTLAPWSQWSWAAACPQSQDDTLPFTLLQRMVSYLTRWSYYLN